MQRRIRNCHVSIDPVSVMYDKYLFVLYRQWCQWQVILGSLGKGGLRQQITSTDDNGKTFLMYAARYGDLNIFYVSLEMVKDYLSEKDVFTLFEAQDNEGKNVLHHAVETKGDQAPGEVIR